MLNHRAALLLLRNRLLSTVVHTTGATTLGSTAKTYTRATGSFVADGFVPGSEVVPVGFTGADPDIVIGVSELTLTTLNTHPALSAAPGRTLVVGLPSSRSWENVQTGRTTTRWAIEEDYIPGGSFKFGGGPGGSVEHYPTYVLRVIAPAGFGSQAMSAVTQKLMELFPPMLALPFASPSVDILRVRTAPCPYLGQSMLDESGNATVVFTVPLITRTSNPI